ncbi:MAG: phosphoglycerate mutase [Pseudomonadales bacterium RIFCSPLOWO2_12_60_38]|jgi:broad specificity phosphatase PhoE|uniref:histidine phosphatase family protein n=1 Tax=Pseudomonas TaxID=286 RepID=UPI0003574843|nr:MULTISPECIES: histidine phosphatase family protein [Pseudomonas]AOS73539.1 phosphoglycerate mutase [Pseudomonas fluorescens]ETK39827.1 phosphoglycerate mutase [Pseudomonas fluorescens FH5]NLT86620.1 histidine phosphatase family protein [Pseudomonas lactis]OHC31337.1 MAG: phosphoglycerate mutase [Pseudomonadales bacterium RIFCSPLOWO2_12_60_38]OHC36636.1 MAG: phosphoglycerate mutase [Pseudomonadales bacterium RIFCSPLOWO2_12_FULL_59_450]
MPATRLTLICHAITPLQKQGRFSDDESVTMDWQGAALSLAGRYKQQARLVCGPEVRARQTAGLFGNNAQVEPALRDLDVGIWKGQAIGQLDSETLNTWATDSTSAAHGGESVGQLCMRVGQWLKSLETQPGHVIAVTHPFVIRAAMLYVMQLPVLMFYRIDVEPLSSVELRFNGYWRLRLMA